MSAMIIIDNGTKKPLIPVVLDDVEWSLERTGTAGKLTFKVVADKKLKIDEGNQVRFIWNGQNVFFGWIFTRKFSKDGIVSITAYDQLRYFKNKDTMVFEGKTATEIIKSIIQKYQLKSGELADTKYKFPSVVEDNQTLFDIVNNALSDTVMYTKSLFVLYDDFGKLVLKNIKDMAVKIIIDSETAQDFDYSSSIDENTYNKVKIIFDNEDTGSRDVFIAQDQKNINKWGVLQYFDKLKKGENGVEKVNQLLSMYNKKTRKLTIKDAFGDLRVRAGSRVAVLMTVDDVVLSNYMLVESCKHKFKQDEHTMELKLRGGEFV